MSEQQGGIQIVVAPAGGWCEPETGVCHIDGAADGTTAGGSGDEADGAALSGATRR